MPTSAYAHIKTDLLALGGHRVWSLMVTLFGDLAQESGSSIDGPDLSAIMAQMEVKPEAVRVALHRLRNDGWIASERLGRMGRHSLTPTSRIETLQASRRIYADPDAQDGDWQLALLEDPSSVPREEMARLGFVPLLPRLYIGGATAMPPQDVLHLAGGSPPAWLHSQIAPLMLEAEYTALLPVLRRAGTDLPKGSLSPLQVAVIRCLIVHNWRRIVLRHPALPRALLRDDWIGHRCHHAVHALLGRFPRPDRDAILPG